MAGLVQLNFESVRVSTHSGRTLITYDSSSMSMYATRENIVTNMKMTFFFFFPGLCFALSLSCKIGPTTKSETTIEFNLLVDNAIVLIMEIIRRKWDSRISNKWLVENIHLFTYTTVYSKDWKGTYFVKSFWFRNQFWSDEQFEVLSIGLHSRAKKIKESGYTYTAISV